MPIKAIKKKLIKTEWCKPLRESGYCRYILLSFSYIKPAVEPHLTSLLDSGMGTYVNMHTMRTSCAGEIPIHYIKQNGVRISTNLVFAHMGRAVYSNMMVQLPAIYLHRITRKRRLYFTIRLYGTSNTESMTTQSYCTRAL